MVGFVLLGFFIFGLVGMWSAGWTLFAMFFGFVRNDDGEWEFNLILPILLWGGLAFASLYV